MQAILNQKWTKTFYWHAFSTIKSSCCLKIYHGYVQDYHDFGRTEQFSAFLSNAQLGRKLQHLLLTSLTNCCSCLARSSEISQGSHQNGFIFWGNLDLLLPHHCISMLCTRYSRDWTFGAAESFLLCLINLGALHWGDGTAIWAGREPHCSFYPSKCPRNYHWMSLSSSFQYVCPCLIQGAEFLGMMRLIKQRIFCTQGPWLQKANLSTLCAGCWNLHQGGEGTQTTQSISSR